MDNTAGGHGGAGIIDAHTQTAQSFTSRREIFANFHMSEGVHADDFTAQVDKRPAGIFRVDFQLKGECRPVLELAAFEQGSVIAG